MFELHRPSSREGARLDIEPTVSLSIQHTSSMSYQRGFKVPFSQVPIYALTTLFRHLSSAHRLEYLLIRLLPYVRADRGATVWCVGQDAPRKSMQV